jgi:DNA-binding NarL/FixJ family response regulator
MAAKILIVEDNFLVAESLGRLLADYGFAVIGSVDTADGALRQIELGEPDCVRLDINLREGSALDLARGLRERGVPFVVVTGYSRDTLPAEFQEAPYIGKPMSESELIGAVQLVCQCRSQA